MNTLTTEIFHWVPPDMSAPVDVTIAFNYIDRYDPKTGQDYEEPDPYVEAIYVGNVDIMPIVDHFFLELALEAYLQDKKDSEDFYEPY
jgi:hypothetical protein